KAQAPLHAYLAHFDGRTWSRDSVPVAAGFIEGYVRDAGGHAWMMTREGILPYRYKLWTSGGNGLWSEIVPPRECGPSHLWAPLTSTDDGSVWVNCESGTVLSTRA